MGYVGNIHDTTYFALFSRVSLLSIEYTDSAYVVFMKLLD